MASSLKIGWITLAFLAAFWPACSSDPPGGSTSPPNLVLIIADDMAWDDSRPYGRESIQTPQLERLAREGMRFDLAFLTASSCSPSRASLVTGRFPHNTDAEQLHWPLPAEQTTFVELLTAAGYWTAAAGKWHLGEAVKDRFQEVREGGQASFQLPSGQTQPGSMVGQAGDKSGCEQWVPLLRDRPRDRPFFLWLAAFDPHRDYEDDIIPQPHRPEDVAVPPYLPDTPEVRKDLALYYDEIARLDSYVGQVLDELESQGAASNTLVLFMSDNGRPFPRAKTTLYDSGIRTPWIVRWPGRVPAGSSCARLVSSIDIAPTFLEAAGVEVPAALPGRSFLPLLSDPETPGQRYVFAERNWHDYEDRVRAVRSERFKFIRNDYPDLPMTPPADAVRSPTFRSMQRLHSEGGLSPDQQTSFLSPRPAEELYDTQADPHELRNLAGDPQYREILEELRAELADWEKRTNDALPKVRTPDEFDRQSGDPLPNRLRPRPGKQEFYKLLEQ